MTDPLTLMITIVLFALIFDFINGFHDASNSIATIVATRVLKYKHAVAWAAFFNFIAFFTMATGVAKTMGSGLIDLSYVTPLAIIAALLGGIVWNLLTWWWGIPASSSHTLLGAYAGAVFAHILLSNPAADVSKAYFAAPWLKVALFIVVAPMVGLFLAFVVNIIVRQLQKRIEWSGWKKFYSVAQLVSSAALSFNHGANDAQKTAGIIASGLVVGGFMAADNFHIPIWVLFAAHVVIALGTLTGGWRITKTLGFKLSKLKPRDGFSAESGAAASIALATFLHIPISTTLATTGSIVGVGMASGRHNVKWRVFARIAAAWLATIPVAFALGGAFLWLLQAITG